MRKIMTLVIVLLFSIVSLHAQQGIDYSVQFNSGTITPQENVSSVNKKRSGNLDDYLFGERYYVLLQFNEMPSRNNIILMENAGIIFYNYVPNLTYSTSVPQSLISNLEQYGVRAIFGLPEEDKTAPEVNLSETPIYATPKKGYCALNIAYYSDVDQSFIINELTKKYGASIVYNAVEFSSAGIHIQKTKVDQLKTAPWLKRIELNHPLYQPDNMKAKTSHRSNVLEAAVNEGGFGLSGKGVKVGLWDTDVKPHPDFEDRYHIMEAEWANSHGNHTAGTIMGAGIINSAARGMAPMAELFSWNFNVGSNGLPEYVEMANAADSYNISISSHSYGIGFDQLGYIRDYWYIDHNRDLVSYLYPELTNVTSAGNDGEQRESSGHFKTTTKRTKNEIVVGALENNDEIAEYSSRGPSNDGRLMPTVSAVGTGVLSTVYNNGYGKKEGTSMATPGVSGVLAQLTELYKNTNRSTPPSCLLKAAISNTAYDLGNQGPDFTFGYGRIDGYKAAQLIKNKQFVLGKVAKDDLFSHNISVPAGAKKLRAMVVWVDPPAEPFADNALVNDLDLRVKAGGTYYGPYILKNTPPFGDPAMLNNIDNLSTNDNAGSDVSDLTPDRVNNIEQVEIPVSPGRSSFNLEVFGHQVAMGENGSRSTNLKAGGKQSFALVWWFEGESGEFNDFGEFTFPMKDEKVAFDDMGNFFIRWNAFHEEAEWFSLQFSVDGGETFSYCNSQAEAEEIPVNRRQFKWIMPTQVTGPTILKIGVWKAGSPDVKIGEFEQHFVVTGGGGFVIDDCSREIIWESEEGEYDFYNLYYMNEYGNISNPVRVYRHVFQDEHWDHKRNGTDTYIYNYTKEGKYAIAPVASGVELERSTFFQAYLIEKIDIAEGIGNKEDFESNSSKYYALKQSSVTSAQIVESEGNKFARLSGEDDLASVDEDGIVIPNKLTGMRASLKSCPIDVDGIEKPMLRFNMRQKTFKESDRSLFYVEINGETVEDIYGESKFYADRISSVQSNTPEPEWKDLIFEIPKPTRTDQNTSVVIELIGYNKSRVGTYVDIDNIQVYDLPDVDLEVIDVDPISNIYKDDVPDFSTNSEWQEPTITVRNNGKDKITDFTYLYTFQNRMLEGNANETIEANETVKIRLTKSGGVGPAAVIPAGERESVNLGTRGDYRVKALVQKSGDENRGNNTIEKVVRNYGSTAIAMIADEEFTATLTDDITFFSPGGVAGYTAASNDEESVSVVTLYPSVTGGVLQVDFSMFSLDQLDNLEVEYGLASDIAEEDILPGSEELPNGRIAFRFHARSRPGTIVSQFPDGRIAFRFHQNGQSQGAEGFIANISTVAPIKRDAGVIAIETTIMNGTVYVSAKVKNYGIEALINIPISFECGLNVATESITTRISPDEIIDYAFQTSFPFEFNGKKISVFTTVNGDANVDNDTKEGTVDQVCAAAGRPTHAEWNPVITDVSLGSFHNHQTEDGAAGYQNYSDMVIDLEPGTEYPISVTVGHDMGGENSFIKDNVGAWIDWNGNNQLDDEGEEIMLTPEIGTGIYYTGVVKVPSNPSAGKLKFRVRVDDDAPVMPCGVGLTGDDYGEVEDYSVKIKGYDTSLSWFGFLQARNPGLSTDLYVQIDGDLGHDISSTFLYFNVPAGTDLSGLIASFLVEEGATVEVKDIIQGWVPLLNGISKVDFSILREIRITSENGDKKNLSY